MIAMLLPWDCHCCAIAIALSGCHCHEIAMLLLPKMSLPCYCQAIATLLPCCSHAIAMLLPCPYWHATSVCLPCSSQAPAACCLVAMRLPCHCHAIAMRLPCNCHAIAMLLQCRLANFRQSLVRPPLPAGPPQLPFFTSCAGVARFMGTATTCGSLGLLEKVDVAGGPAASQGTKRKRGGEGEGDAGLLRLGLTGQPYRATGNIDKVRLFQSACQNHSNKWQEALKEGDLMVLVPKVHAIIHGVAMESGGSVQAQSRDGYVRLSLVRKLLLGCLAFGKVQPDWDAVPLSMLAEMGPDENQHLKAFSKEFSVGAVGRFVFARADWGIFVSMFTCLWHALAEQRPTDRENILRLLASGAVGAKARSLAKCSGHAWSPRNVVEELSRGQE